MDDTAVILKNLDFAEKILPIILSDKKRNAFFHKEGMWGVAPHTTLKFGHFLNLAEPLRKNYPTGFIMLGQLCLTFYF